jgi:hypothetical protein
MRTDRTVLQNCGSCGGSKPIVFKIDRPITSALLETFRSLSFNELAHFTKAGMLYFDNPNLTVTGPLGSDRLNVKCKAKVDCDKILNDFENLLKSIP